MATGLIILAAGVAAESMVKLKGQQKCDTKLPEIEVR
jgi:hypothetical protein